MNHGIVRDAAEAGKDVFAEKPMSYTPAHARTTVETAGKHCVKLMVAYMLRMHRQRSLWRGSRTDKPAPKG